MTYNHEVKSTYNVVIKADDSNGGTDTITVTITITDVNEAPGRPAAPSVSGTAGSTTNLTVSWAAPDNTGPDINNYDLQYRQGTSGSFTSGPQKRDRHHHDHPEPFSQHVVSGAGARHQRRGR